MPFGRGTEFGSNSENEQAKREFTNAVRRLDDKSSLKDLLDAIILPKGFRPGKNDSELTKSFFLMESRTKDLYKQTINALYRNGYETIEQVKKATDLQISKIKGIGDKTIELIRELFPSI